MVFLAISLSANAASDSSVVSRINRAVYKAISQRDAIQAEDSLAALAKMSVDDSRNQFFIKLNRALLKSYKKRYVPALASLDSLCSTRKFERNYPILHLKAVFGKAKIYRATKETEQAISLFDSLINKAAALNSSYFTGVGYYYKGRIYEDKGLLNESILEYEGAIKSLQDYEGNHNVMGQTTKSLGIVYRKLGLYSKATDYYVRALDEYMARKDLSGVASMYNSMGILSTSKSEYPKGLRYFKKALLYDSLADSRRSIKMNVLNNIVVCYLGQEQYDSARVKLLMNVKLARKAKNRIELGKAMNNFAIAYKGLEQYELSKRYYYKSLHLKRLTKQESFVAATKLGLAHAHLLSGNLDSAGYYFELLSQNIGHKTSLKSKHQYYELLVSYYRARNDFEQALSALDSTYQLFEKMNQGDQADLQRSYESLFNMKAAQLENEELREMIEKEQEMAVITEEKAKSQRRIIWVTVGVLLVFIFLLVFIWKERKKLRISNEKLESTNARLQESLSDNREIISIVAHDLKAPMGQIKGLIDLMRDDDNLNPEQLGFMKIIDKVFDNNDRLINNLTLAHQNESRPLKITSFSVSDVLREAKDRFNGQAFGKEIRLILDVEDGIYLATDHDLLSRVIDNFLSNAIKFSPPEENVIIKAVATSKATIIAIQDFGPGIATEERSKLFKRFQRLDNKPTGGESSSGLGLYITKTIADKLNADITVDSKKGEGSTFSIAFKN